MPYPNEHSARLVDPNKFIPESFRRKNIADGIDIIIGKLKGGDGSMVTQAYRFDVDKFTAAEAKKWLKDHGVDYILFEPAKKFEEFYEQEKAKLPKPKQDEEIANFNKRCMNDSFMQNEFPDNNQRMAMCSAIYRHSDIKENFEINSLEEKNMNEIKYKIYPFEITKTLIEKKDGNELGIFHGAMATEHRDRSGDIIAPEAFDKTLARYKKEGRNIRLFYQHQHDDLPIGIIPIKSVKKDDKNWNVKGELNLDTQKGSEVYSLMKQGALSDLSIGYTPNETDWKGKTRIIKELELWEVSVVSEPANPKAIISEIKAVPSFQDFDLAPDDAEWPGDEVIPRIRKYANAEDAPNADYKKYFFYYDSENADQFGSYKYAYVDIIGGKPMVIPRRIYNVAALLKGARGGLVVPEEDQKKIVVQVNKYYDKMGRESPLKSKEISRHYEFLINEFINKKFEISDVELISTKKEFEEILRESGLFSKQAAIYLASFFIPKQSESAAEHKETLKDLLVELKGILNKL